MARAVRFIYTGGGVINSGPHASASSCASWPRSPAFPITSTLMGLGAYPGLEPAVPGHAGHARDLRGQPRHARMRRDGLYRRPVRRPHHRPSRRVLAESPRRSTSTSMLPRSTRWFKRRCSASSAICGNRCSKTCCAAWKRLCPSDPDQGRLRKNGGMAKIRTWKARPQLASPIGRTMHDHQAAIRGAAPLRGLTKDREDLRHHGGRPAPDVGGAVLQASTSRTAG